MDAGVASMAPTCSDFIAGPVRKPRDCIDGDVKEKREKKRRPQAPSKIDRMRADDYL